MKRVLVRFRRICLALPEAEETTSFGHPTFRVGKKTFAVLDEYKGEHAICFKATLAEQALLTLDPQFYVAPYIGKHGWTSLRLDGTPLEWREVEELVHESYRLVMPKRLQRVLDVEPERTRRK